MKEEKPTSKKLETLRSLAGRNLNLELVSIIIECEKRIERLERLLRQKKVAENCG